ncbi:MAG: site-2 protease family protein [Thalassobaculum sp.]|uniref:site-2 protease family protein n=1 Tax=Thalassobaculum sp. TaxID=2022740 RepID=UPI0032ECE91E
MDGSEIAGLIRGATVWIIPVILAITLHEAAHGWAASRLGDPTARLMGRVTLNPLAHIDPFGTLVLPALLLIIKAPFLFGYAKPVPVNFSRLNNPRRDMALVALAGPASNVLLAAIAALLFHLVDLVPDGAVEWVTENLRNLFLLNLVLAVFNMLPIPPLDGGRILVAVLPDRLAWKVARLERAGLFVVIAVLFLLPFMAAQLGVTLDVARTLIWTPVETLASVIMTVTGH